MNVRFEQDHFTLVVTAIDAKVHRTSAAKGWQQAVGPFPLRILFVDFLELL